MIARIWHGATPRSKSDEYYEYVMRTGIPAYRATEGNQGVYLLRKVTADRAEFLLISLWEDRSPSDEDSRTSGQGGKERLRIQYLARSPDSRGIRG